MFSFLFEGPSVAFLLCFHDSCFSENISIYFSFLKNSFGGFFLSSRTFNLVIFWLFFFQIFEREKKKSVNTKAPLFVTSCSSLYLRLWVFLIRESHIVQAGWSALIYARMYWTFDPPASTWLVLCFQECTTIKRFMESWGQVPSALCVLGKLSYQMRYIPSLSLSFDGLIVWSVLVSLWVFLTCDSWATGSLYFIVYQIWVFDYTS